MLNDPAKAQSGWKERSVCAMGAGAVVLLILGLAIRLTVRDRFLVANTVYYATPWSVLFVLGVVSLVWLTSRRAARVFVAALAAVTAGCGGMWVHSGWRFRGDSDVVDGVDGVRFVTWNLGHGRWGLDGLAEFAAELKPDIALFVEADPSHTDVRETFKKAFPEHRVFLLGGGIVLVSRWPGGEARAYQIGSEAIESRIREIDIETPWGTWTVFGCDLASNIVYQREPHFRELAARLAKSSHPVIVAGDFNTPLDSIHLDLLRELGFQEAFQAAGAGYLPTWPVPAPVLSLDQVWTGRQLSPMDCVRSWNWRSDHAAVIARIRLKDRD